MRLKVLILTLATVSARHIDRRDYFLVQPSLEYGAQFGSNQRDVTRDVNRGRIGGRQTGQRRFEPEVIYYEVSTALYQREFHQRSNDDRNGYNSQLRLNDRSVERNHRRDSENWFQPNHEERTTSNIGQFTPIANYNRNKVRDRSISSNDQRNSNAYEGSQLGYEREQQNRNVQQQFDGNVNRNYETSSRRTNTRQYETRLKYPDEIISTTQYDTRPYNSGSKTTIDNEVSNHETRDGQSQVKAKVFDQLTTGVPETVTLDNRGAFDGDRCPTGKTRVGDMCVDID